MNLRTLWIPLLYAAGLFASEPVTPLDCPAPEHTNEPNLHTGPDGTTYLTYSGPGLREGERALWLSRLAPDSAAWSRPLPIVSTPRLMENWADFASLTVATDGVLWAQWFERPEDPGALGYSGRVARSADGGATWSVSAPLGHEFVSLAPLSGGRVMAVWLESTRPPRRAGDPPPAPRPSGPAQPSMRLCARLLAPDGTALRDWIVDPDVCNCCQTSVATLPNDRLAVAYRGHTPEEIRDMRLVRFEGGAWLQSESLHEDGWQISACPVNGPALDSTGGELAVVWFTGAHGRARVHAKHRTSADGRWTAPAVADLGRPLGRVDLVTLGDGTALISWLEAGDTAAEAGLHLRHQLQDGTLSPPVRLARTNAARASGFARLAARKEHPTQALVAWTEVLAEAAGGRRALTRVRTARIDVAAFARSEGRLGAIPGLNGPALVELCDPRIDPGHP